MLQIFVHRTYTHICEGPFLLNFTYVKRSLKRWANALPKSLIHWQYRIGLYTVVHQILRLRMSLITTSFEKTMFSINGTDLSSKGTLLSSSYWTHAFITKITKTSKRRTMCGPSKYSVQLAHRAVRSESSLFACRSYKGPWLSIERQAKILIRLRRFRYT